MPRHHTFRLYVIGRIDGTNPASLTTMAEFRAARAVERVELSTMQRSQLSRKFDDLRQFVEEGQPEITPLELRDLGMALFDCVIQRSVRDLFRRATGPDQAVLPFEVFVEDYEIADWPWEYLYDPTNKLFVCQEFHPVSRGIFTPTPGRLLADDQSSLRVLILLGLESGDPSADVDEQERSIKDVFQAYLAEDDVGIDVHRAIGPEQIEKILLTAKQAGRPYDVVHFFGHAGFDESCGEGYLEFARPNQSPYAFYANDFGRALWDYGVRLVFLNACETGRGGKGTDPTRSSVAAALVDRGVPAVIATQFAMPEWSSHLFASLIYNALVIGLTLGEAVLIGRRAMSFARGRQFFDWGIPVLYTSDPSLSLVKKPAEPKAWVESFRKALESREAIRQLLPASAAGAPSLTAQPIDAKKSASATVRVALIDLDAKVTFLPGLVDKLNTVQSYVQFQVAFVPVPAGTTITDFRKYFEARQSEPKKIDRSNEKDELDYPHFNLPRVARYLSDLRTQLKVDYAYCLTAQMVADGGVGGEAIRYGLLMEDADNDGRVTVISTARLRQYAREAGVSFPKATLYLCVCALLDSLVADLEFHEEAVGCPMDECPERGQLVVGLKRMKFNHAACRRLVKDAPLLEAIDALLACDVAVVAPPEPEVVEWHEVSEIVAQSETLRSAY